MSRSAFVSVCYGIDFGSVDNDPEGMKFDDAEDDQTHGSPSWLHWTGGVLDMLKVTVYGHSDHPGIALVVATSEYRGPDWSAMPIPELPILADWNGRLRDYCAKHGLEARQPLWYALPIYR